MHRDREQSECRMARDGRSYAKGGLAMGNMYFHVGGTITGHDVQRLNRILPEIDNKEELTIVMEASDSIQSDAMLGLLERQGFDHYVKDGHHDGYTIVASRKR